MALLRTCCISSRLGLVRIFGICKTRSDRNKAGLLSSLNRSTVKVPGVDCNRRLMVSSVNLVAIVGIFEELNKITQKTEKDQFNLRPPFKTVSL